MSSNSTAFRGGRFLIVSSIVILFFAAAFISFRHLNETRKLGQFELWRAVSELTPGTSKSEVILRYGAPAFVDLRGWSWYPLKPEDSDPMPLGARTGDFIVISFDAQFKVAGVERIGSFRLSPSPQFPLRKTIRQEKEGEGVIAPR